MTQDHRRTRHAFSLLELIVVLGILLMTLGFLLPALARAGGGASRAACQNNLKQIAIAMHNCNDTYKRLPPTAGTSWNGKQASALFHLLPFVEQNALYQSGDIAVVIPVFLCPSDKSGLPNHLHKERYGTGNYAVNWKVFGDGNPPARIPQTFVAGTSNTIAFTERYEMCGGQPCAWGYSGIYYWTPMVNYYSEAPFQPQPKAEQCDPALAQSIHGQDIQVALGDASVRAVSSRINPATWGMVCNPKTTKLIPQDWNN
jgi:type II secretory pathway pseudopilin PulG